MYARSTGRLAALGLTLAILLSKADVATALRRARRFAQGVVEGIAAGMVIRTQRRQRSEELLPASEMANHYDNCALLMTADELYTRLEREQCDDLVVIEVVPPSHPRAIPPIPGAESVWRPEYQLPVNGAAQPLDGLVPTAEAFGLLAQRLGVHEATQIVLITSTSTRGDDTRLWWLFTAFGKRSVFVLDGGFDAWRRCAEARGPLAPNPRGRLRGTWCARALDPALLASRQAVAEQRVRLWDVRAPEEYDGRVTMPGAARPGRIPWATRRVEHGMFKSPTDGTWLPPEGIREVARRELDATPTDGGGAHVFYCQSAVRTTQLIFGMCRAGWPLERLKNYDGSWVEWSHLASDDEVHVADAEILNAS